MEMKEVKSSNIAALGYDAKQKTLAVKFNSGATWHYNDVPQEEFDSFSKAKSIGSHFATSIRPKFTGVLAPKKKD